MNRSERPEALHGADLFVALGDGHEHGVHDPDGGHQRDMATSQIVRACISPVSTATTTELRLAQGLLNAGRRRRAEQHGREEGDAEEDA